MPSVELSAGLELMTRRSRPELVSRVGCLTDRTIQAPCVLEFYLEVLRKNSLPSSFIPLGEFSSLQLQDIGPHFLAGCCFGGSILVLRGHFPVLVSGPLHLQSQQWNTESSFQISHLSFCHHP